MSWEWACGWLAAPLAKFKYSGIRIRDLAKKQRKTVEEHFY
jgi:hypothetical protein